MNQKIYLKIAGYVIEMKFIITDDNPLATKFIKETIDFYSEFILKDKPKKIIYFIKVVNARYLKCIAKHINNTKKAKSNFAAFYSEDGHQIVTFYHISQFQLLALITRLIEKELKDKGFFLHASASLIEDKANVFLGRSGAGKSTAVRLLKGNFPPIADDIAIIKKENHNYYLYQFPYFEKVSYLIKNTAKYPIKRIFFLNKDHFFNIVKIKNKNKIIKKITQIYHQEHQYVKKHLPTIIKFVLDMDCYFYLYFAKNKKKLIQLLQ